MTATIVLAVMLASAVIFILGMIRAYRATEAQLRASWAKNDDLRVEARTLRLKLDLMAAELPHYGRDEETGRFVKRGA